jgi:hypothetical protein
MQVALATTATAQGELTALDTRPWAIPVMIACRRSGTVHTITSTREAFWMLFNVWPVAEGKAYFSALELCDGVSIGRISPEEARLAFLAAAEEAKLPYDLLPVAVSY